MSVQDTVLGIDFETCSKASISWGADAYASHPTTRMRCAVLHLVQLGICIEEIEMVDDYTLPAWAQQHIAAGGLVCAHNVAFELSIIRRVLSKSHGWPNPRLGQWVDTLSLAAALSLPTSLEGLGTALGLAVQKDTEGGKLMKRLADPDVVPTPEELERLVRYCATDVATMLEALSRLNTYFAGGGYEQELQRVDRVINSRGVYVDQTFAAAMARMADRRLDHLDTLTAEASDYDLFSTSPEPLKRHLADAGVDVPETKRKNGTTSASLDRATVQGMLDGDLPDAARQVLQLRQEASRSTSLKKLSRVENMLSADGRLRHSLRIYGAHTGRWTSGGLQVHNLPKSKLKPEQFAALRTAVEADDLAAAEDVCPDVLQGLSWLLRSLISAPPGYELLGGDYAAIEARVLPWLAGQDDVLALFERGVDVYTEDAKKLGSDNRQLGKVARLALGYGMGAIKFRDKAAEYGVALSLKDAIAAQKLWRTANPAIVQFWANLETAVRDAIETPRTVFHVGQHVKVATHANALWVRLPSGRSLAYWQPHVKVSNRLVQCVTDDGEIVERQFTVPEIRYCTEGKDRKSMAVFTAYGGLLAENVTQAVARDLLASALVRLDAYGYRPVLHVHDSIVVEVPEGADDVGEFVALMEENPRWAPGLPTKVEGYRSKHFRG